MSSPRVLLLLALANLSAALVWIKSRTFALPAEASWGLVGFWASANAAAWLLASLSRREEQARLARVAGRSRNLLVAEFLSYSLFHIREYLSSVTSVAEKLALSLTGPSEKEQAGRLRQVVAECNQKVARMLEDVTANATTRRPAGRYDVRGLLEECLLAARAAAPAPSARVSLSCPDAGEASGDREAAACALISVLTNALESVSARGRGGRVLVRARRGEPFVDIEVADDGGGIPADELPRVFSPLHSRKPGGLGLGLSMSRRILERAGGTLNVHSERGKTRVRVQLPVEPALPLVRGEDATWPQRRARP